MMPRINHYCSVAGEGYMGMSLYSKKKPCRQKRAGP